MTLFGVELVFTLVVLALVSWYYRRWNKRKGMPPGPSGLPILGNAHQLNLEDPKADFDKLRQQYGDIFTINVMGKYLVVISSYELGKEMCITKDDIFSAREISFKHDAYKRFMEDVNLSSPSPTWTLKKKALFTSLKMYGEELLKLEKITLECIQDTLETIDSTGGKPFNPRECIHILTEQILAVLILGERLSDRQLKSIMDCQEIEHTKHNNQGGPGWELELFPWLRHFGHKMWKEIKGNADNLWSIYSEMIQRRKAVFDINNPECVLDGLLALQAKELGTVLNDDMMHLMMFDLFEAGVITTLRSTLSLIAILANLQDVQEQMQKEIDEIIGNNEPRLQDRHEMHYTSACIHEFTRYTTIVPFLMPHMASEDGTLGSYKIPKGTQLWCNVYGINHDPQHWNDPYAFKPERYLDEQGHLVSPDHPNRRRNLIFGAGKRVCAGEVMAKNRLFLFITSLFQKFKFLPTEGERAPSHDPRTYQHSLTMVPRDYEVIAQPRK